MPDELVLTKELLQKLLNYLGSKSYVEVAPLIQEIAKAVECQIPKS